MRKFMDSYQYASTGVKYVARTQRNFTIQLTALSIMLMAGFYFKLSAVEWMLIILVSANVLVLEMINTALETVVDLVTLEYHDLAKIAKDVAAGAVLLMSFTSIILGAIIFLPKIFTLIGVL